MKKRTLLLIFTLLVTFFVQAQEKSSNIAIGKWRDHLSYYYTHNVDKVKGRILVSCESALFYYDPNSQEIEKYSKVNGLSDAGLGITAYDSTTNTIIITYENSNIDIVQDDKVYNIPDIKNRSIEGSKEINSISFYNNKAYLSCGFGIVVLDLTRHEIYDTYYLGENSSAINVNCVYINDTSIFAGTVNGLLYADKNSNALASSETWKNKNMVVGNNYKEVNYILPLNSKDLLINILMTNSTHSYLTRYNGNTLTVVDSDAYIINLRRCQDKIVRISYLSLSIMDSSFNQIYHISDQWNPVSGLSLDLKDAIIDNNDLWISHTYSGLVHIPNYTSGITSTKEIIFPNGPMTNNVYSITASKTGKIFVAPGGKDITNANKGLLGDVYTYEGFYWNNLEDNILRDSTKDILNITIDPNDENHLMAASWWNGVIEIDSNKVVKIYDITNTDSLITPYNNSYRIAAVQYDASGNLIIANSLATNNLAFLNYHGQWGAFATNSFLPNVADEIVGLTLDNVNFYKLLFTASNKILVLNNNGDMLFIDPNNGSLLSTSKINCITQDKEGEMWIGTEKGIKVIYDLSSTFSSNSTTTSNVECNNIVYDEQGIAQYLLSFENITCIMVDGANRKWVGTERNGIYVLSESGDKELYHFTIENSPLFSGKIVSMAQNPITGEVFIGTDRGLISYRAESTEGAAKAGELTTYPNPIKEDYNGTIAIKGFVKDSDVRITDATGKMVAHLKSLGGQAIWDGKNFKGQRVGTGVYFIFSSANEGKDKADGKFLIIR